jgi:plasmid stabilization system protein ParE
VISVRWSARARAEFKAILDTENELDSLPARSYSDRIVGAIEQIRNFPFSGSQNEKLHVHVFSIPHTPYAIYYRPVEFEIELVTIRHGARQPIAHL